MCCGGTRCSWWQHGDSNHSWSTWSHTLEANISIRWQQALVQLHTWALTLALMAPLGSAEQSALVVPGLDCLIFRRFTAKVRNLRPQARQAAHIAGSLNAADA